MKNFTKFLEEVTVKGNPGVPGEDGDKNDKQYLSDIEKKNREKYGPERMPERDDVFKLISSMEKSKEYITGKEEQLEELAKEIILDNFGDFLSDVKLDIKLLTNSSDVSKFKQEEEEEEMDMPNFEKIKDPELKKKIHKAKLNNIIIQGEAKNTKHIIRSGETLNKLKDIYGDDAEDVLDVWNTITDINDKFDWIVPLEIKGNMIKEAPEGGKGEGGAVKVDWEDKKEEDKSPEDILDDIENGEELDNEDLEDLEDSFEDVQPVIKARGVDFPMLIHETVKGIMELIVSVTLPSEHDSEEKKKESSIIQFNVSSPEDEMEDFRTGPEIAADLRDFINKNDKTDKYPNLRFYVFGEMVKLPADEFLTLFRGILNNEQSTRDKIDKMIDKIVEELDKWEYEEAVGEYDDESEESSEKDTGEPEKYEEEPYSEEELQNLPQREIQNLIDDALDKGDYKEVEKLSNYLKEGKQIYLNEIKRINENHSFRSH